MGVLPDPWATAAFLSLVLGAGPALPLWVISDLSAAFRPDPLSSGRGNVPLRAEGVEAGESRPCIEMGLTGSWNARPGLGGGGWRGGVREWGRRQGGVDTNRSFVSLFFLSCQNAGGISVDFFSLSSPPPFLG